MARSLAQEVTCVLLVVVVMAHSLTSATPTVNREHDTAEEVTGMVLPADYYDYYDTKTGDQQQVSPADLEHAFWVMNNAWRSLYQQAAKYDTVIDGTAPSHLLAPADQQSAVARAVAKRFASKRQMRYKQCFFNPVTCFGHRK